MIRELIHQLSRLFTWIIIVAPWEQALRVRLGKRVRKLGPGWYWCIPFMDRVYRQSIRRRLSLIAPQTLTTKDRVAITVSGSIGYSIKDLERLYNTLHDAAETIETEAAAIVAGFIATHTMEECSPPLIEEHVRGKLKLQNYGLSTGEFWITSFASVKTYRFITGEFRSWSRAEALNTTAIATSAAVVN